MLAAIYARYSSDLQREESIEDQVRLCRERVEQMGGKVVTVYADAAISGSRLQNRPGIRSLLDDARAHLPRTTPAMPVAGATDGSPVDLTVQRSPD